MFVPLSHTHTHTHSITSSDLRKFLAKINNKNLLNRARAIFTVSGSEYWLV